MTRPWIGLAFALTASGCASQSSSEAPPAASPPPETARANDAPVARADLGESHLCRCTTCVPEALCETHFRPGAERQTGNCFEESYRVPVGQSCETARSERCCD